MSEENRIAHIARLDGENASEAIRIIGELTAAGFVAYLAGGCVRDELLGRVPKDYDVATNATPDSVRKVFGRANTLAYGASFGVIGVLPPKGRLRDSDEPTVQPTEVATFRSDGDYSDGRRPDSVHFGNAMQDALRRDFTINGLFYDPAAQVLIDFVGGDKDLKAGILRTIGDAEARIGEDKLRMLRAVRFATTLGFELEQATAQAVADHASEIEVVSGERIGAEMRRILGSSQAISGLTCLQALRLSEVVFPEWDASDAVTASSRIDQLAEPAFVDTLACLLSASPKPVQALRAITSRWKLSNEETRQVRWALDHWSSLAKAHELPWSTVQPLLIDRDIAVGLAVAKACVLAAAGTIQGIDLVSQALQWPTDQLNPPPLLTGDDLRKLGVPAGPEYRTILQAARDAQLNDQIHCKQDAIARFVHE